MKSTDSEGNLELLALRIEDFSDAADRVDVLITPDKTVQSSSGNFIIDDESFASIDEGFRKHSTDLVVDYEHQTLGGKYASPDGTAPAAGFVKALKYEKDRGIVASVAWTARARKFIKDGEYKYLSPVVIVRTSDRKAVGLHSIGLTNKPAIVGMERVAAKEPMPVVSVHQENPMDLQKELQKQIGTDTDTAEVLVNKVGELKKAAEAASAATLVANAARTALGLKPEAGESEVILAVNSLKQSQNAVAAMQTELTAIKNKQAEREVDELIAVHGKTKINPNDPVDVKVCRDVALRDPEEFKKWMAARPVIVEGGRTTAPDGTGKPGDAGSREALIANAVKEFKDDPSLAKMTTVHAFTSLRLQDAGKERLSADEAQKLVA